MKKILLCFLGLLMVILVHAQTFQLDNSSSSLSITGTSSVHDWEIVSTGMAGNFIMDINEDELKVQELQFEVEVKQLESGKSVMNKKTVNALKGEEHPKIKYVTNAPIRLISGEEATASGTLFLAGAKYPLQVNGTVETYYNERVRFKGHLSTKMTDFGIEPPTALMGALKTADEIDIEFNVVFKISE